MRNRERILARYKARYAEDPELFLARSRAYHAANPEKAKERGKRHRQKKGEEIKARTNAWAKANRDKRRESERRYIQANLEKIRARKRAWNQANRLKTRQYGRDTYERNPTPAKANSRNRRARLRLADGCHSVADIAWLLRIQKKQCAHSWCKRSLKKGFHVDHVIPLSLGGSNDRFNIQLLCAPCNLSKNAMHPFDFARKHGNLL